MGRMVLRLWHEEAGTVPGPEWALIATILVLGAITAAMVTSRPAALDDPEPLPALLR
jgi:hypothetical protein